MTDSASDGNDPRHGRTGGLIDVEGLRVGHHTARGDGYLTGTTVILAPEGGMVGGVDVRGGAPGTRETDLLGPTAAVERVHGLVFTGGSAYGLAAASGAAQALGDRGIGIQVGENRSEVVPIVPAAVILDLGRGGSFRARPDADFGRLAVEDALSASAEQMLAEGIVGAGTGACTGQLKGGIGQASAIVPDGYTVAGLLVANANGPGYDLRTGELWAARLMLPADGPIPGLPHHADLEKLRDLASSINSTLIARLRGTDQAGAAAAAAGISHTTLGVIATNAALTKAQCCKLAGIAHDGLARAINPVHTMFDGDLFFGVSTGTGPAVDPVTFHQLLAAAANVVTRAVGRALLSATTVSTAGGSWPSYLDLAPSSLAR